MSEKVPKIEKAAESNIESKEELVVNKIYQFTHPLFHATYFPHQTNRKEYRELRQRWTKAVEEIEHDNHALLFYVTTFTVKEFQDLAKKRSSITGEEAMPFTIREQLIMNELSRIKSLKKKLKDRFLMLSPDKTRDEEPNFIKERERLEAILKNRHLKLPDPEDITINCFGEYLESCVKAEAINLAQLLGVPIEIPRDNSGSYIQPTRELSLSIHDVEEFDKESS
ncbi:MAG: hypothetical protein HYW79_02140 [Parcubacteria group bacterium]|nr:hypothetical protein [Parcubacteria group bacterium]